MDAPGAVNFLTPRDCPRVTFGLDAHTTAADAESWLGKTTARRVVAIEWRWYERLRRCILCEYAMPAASFTRFDDPAGYYVSHDVVRPQAMRTITDLPSALASCNVELRVLPSLWRLRDAVADSSLQFSILRMRNAAPPDDGYLPLYPV